MTTKLAVYNLSLLHLKASTLATITDNILSRRVLDSFWDIVLQEMLEAGFWKFAMRTVEITEDTAVTEAFGYAYPHDFPSDWVKTYAVSASEFLDPLLEDYIEESNLLWAHVTPLYLRYVSNGSSGYGLDLTRWTARFVTAIAFNLAWRGAPKITNASDALIDRLAKDKDAALSRALSFEAMREPSKRIPEGKWNQARRGNNFRGRIGHDG